MIRRPGFVARDHTLAVPLDHAQPDGTTIDVFAREIVAVDREHDDLPWLLFLQGGPGGKSPRPLSADSSWLATALTTHRVLLLDQRGTGRSTPITTRTATERTAQELADYLALFRADAIVDDAEALRRHLVGDATWETLGQSYGGFVTLTYLSRAPHGLSRCYVTGGLPGLDATPADVYRRTFDRAATRTREFYARYPEDEVAIRRLATHLDEHDVRLPDGDPFTTRRLRILGNAFGMSEGFEKIHWLLDDAWDGDTLTEDFRYEFMAHTGFAGMTLWALQEYCYAQGAASGWAAQAEYDRRPEFAPDADPLLLTSEMMFPWMFAEIGTLRPFAAAAELLAAKSDWPALYDTAVLARNEVPLSAAVYYDDLYVDSGLQLDTAARVGNARAWVTNEFEHDGIRASSAVLQRLLDMGAGRC